MRMPHLGRAMEAKLQTADSSGLVYSMISVQRLLHLMVPRFCWLDLRLQLSLYSMYGLPVSTCSQGVGVWHALHSLRPWCLHLQTWQRCCEIRLTAEGLCSHSNCCLPTANSQQAPPCLCKTLQNLCSMEDLLSTKPSRGQREDKCR